MMGVELLHERMSMFTFTDSERAFHTEMRGLTNDGHGREVLVGLTAEETVFYIEYTRQCFSGRYDPEADDRFVELDNKHELARLQIISAEAELRTENAVRH